MKDLYVIWDNKAGMVVADIIQIQPHVAVALRALSDVLRREDSPLRRHPADYELRCLGTIDADGNITPRNELVISVEAHLTYLDIEKAKTLKLEA